MQSAYELWRKVMCFSSLAVKCISAAKENDFPSQLPICLADWLLGSVQALVLQLCLMRASLHESLSKFLWPHSSSQDSENMSLLSTFRSQTSAGARKGARALDLEGVVSPCLWDRELMLEYWMQEMYQRHSCVWGCAPKKGPRTSGATHLPRRGLPWEVETWLSPGRIAVG